MSSNGKDDSTPAVLPEEEDLPPGVRRHNRCHSSSNSDSEDEADKKKKSMNVDSSESESDNSDHDSSKKDGKKRNNSQREIVEHKAGSKEKEIPSKAGRSRSRSDSRSKSRSRSKSPKRRRSSEKSSRRSRSRSRDRRHRRERKHRSHRSRSKERRRSRDRHRHKKDRRRSRSRSRSRDRRDRRYRRSSRDRDRRRRSRSRSRDRRDSRSPSPHDGKVIKFGNKVIKPGASFGRPSSNFSKPVTFKEKMRQQLIKAIEDGADTNDVLAHKGGSTICTQSAGVQQNSIPKPKGPPVPLMEATITPPTSAALAALSVSANDAAIQSMLALQKETTEKTGIEIPKYYNPAAINPMKYAEQVQKRKLLWSKAKDKDVNSQWHATSLSGDADDKSKEKFRKLMGIKNDPSAGEGENEEKQKQLFDQLNKEYEFARMTTHTHRGIGLGFSSSSQYPPPQSSSSLPPQPPQPPPPTG